MRSDDLLAELGTAASGVNRATIDRLRSLGVRPEAFADYPVAPFGTVRAESIGHGLYQPSEDGAPALVVPVVMDGALVDLCAFRAADPGGWMMRTGLGWCLGLENGVNPYTWFDSAALFSTPLDWLQAEGRGLCILDWSATAELRALDVLPHVIVDDAATAAELRRALTAPIHLPKISVKGALAHVA